MNAKKQFLIIVSSVLLIFSSCRKDVTTPAEEQDALDQLAATAVAANDVPETALPVHTARVTYVNANCAGYYETLPARYALTTKRYPLILFIHGIGELGTDIGSVNCCGLPSYISKKQFPAEFVVNGVHHSFIVVSPQFKQRPTAADMQSVIAYASSKYRIDPTRIYITGLSMGGGSTWDYASVYGQNVAAAVPVCGGSAPTQANAKAIASKNLPIWTISSKADQVVPISWAQNWIAWIDAANPAIASKTKISVWTTQTHNDTWYKAFNPTTREAGMDIYEWMLQFTRGGATAPPPPTNPPPTTPPPTNPPTNPPATTGAVARAGADESFAASWNYSPYLNGTTSTSSNGWIVSQTWVKVSGPSGGAIAAPTALKTKASGLIAGVYVYRLTVTDNKGAKASDDIQFTVTGAGGGTPAPPAGGSGAVARAGADDSFPASWNYSPYLNGTTSTSSNGWIVSQSWTKVSGPAGGAIASPTALKTKASGLQVGTYVYRLSITDNKGAKATDDIKFTVTK